MTYSHNELEHPMNWSLRIGRLFDIEIRVHILFILFAAIRILRYPGDLWFGWSFIGILFFSVLLHEFGHCFGARWVGGEAEKILMWPLGGLAYTSTPHRPWARLATVVAGPAVQPLLMFIFGAVVVVGSGTLGALPLNPFYPFDPISPSAFIPNNWWCMLALLAFGLNYIMLLFNLLPIYPLDGGAMVQAIVWHFKGYNRSMEIATLTGMIAAVPLGLLGLLREDFLLVGIAVFGYLTCYQQRVWLRQNLGMESGAFGYDFSKGYGAFDDAKSASRPTWWQRLRARRLAKRKAAEEAMLRKREAEFDRILEKIAKEGMGPLTRAEKRLLQGETERRRGV